MPRTCSFLTARTVAWPCFQHGSDPGTNAQYSRGSSSSYSRFTLEHNDTVSQVSGHNEVVFDDERRLLSVEDVPARQKNMSPPSICDFCRALGYLLMTLLAIIRCSESKKLNGDTVSWPPQSVCCICRSRGWLIQQIDVDIGLAQGQHDGDTLQLST